MPSLAIFNACIHTQDADKPRATALLIDGNRIRLVGGDAEILASASQGAQVVDLKGRLVIPGLVDAHAHLLSWALLMRGLSLSDVSSLKDSLKRVAEKACSLEEGEWLLGWGLDESEWPEARLPTKEELESAAPRNPVFLRRRDGHLAVVNTRALRLAEVRDDAPDPPDGRIDRGVNGRPNGVLRERAVDLISKVIPEPTDKEGEAALFSIFGRLHQLGLTGVCDYRLPGTSEGRLAARIFGRIRDSDGFRIRCFMTLSGENPEESVASGLVPGAGDEKFRIGHLKYFLDGSLGSQTAWMFDPFVDGHRGMPVCSMQEISERIRQADDQGWPVAVHAIGDRANHELIRVFESVFERRRTREAKEKLRIPFPHRIEHVQMIRTEDIARLSRLGVVASVQPLHAPDDMYMNDRWVSSGSQFAYRFKDFFNARIPVVFGSDAPVSDISPIRGIHAAVTRRRRDGDPQGGWFPEQCVTVDEAVQAYTINTAISLGRSSELGSITPGKLADIVVLDQDIYSIDPMGIHKTSAVMTVFDGEIVHREGL